MLDRAFAIVADYLQDATVDGDEVDFWDRGLQLTRSCRALKVWLSIQYLGVEAFRAAIDRCLDLALQAEEHASRRPELELISVTMALTATRERMKWGVSPGRRRLGLVLRARVSA